MKKNIIWLVTITLFGSACTWVKPTGAGSEVALVKSFNVTNCQKLGSTTSRVKHNIGPVDRSKEKVTRELVTLAKNTAADMGGNSIVAQEQTEVGAMTFDVYQCGQ